ncbi:hypothetical protein J5047_003379 [Salmonella enterica]|nr:hypothetical protein [Salmonella enterica]EEF4030297.1 hypothetical protein [Salmonella enterica]EEJ5983480.1 hypothetical protein [Salmonella enterica]EEL9687281.1 hypothetical protein [Salmonella enterica]EEU3909907.1 hypothetical protein [Salmonella enterica]
MISDRLTDEQLAEILSGVVDGVEPTTQELAMATELQELREQNELQRGELLKAHITLLNQQKQLQKYRNVDSAEPEAWTDEQELRDVKRDGFGYLFTVNPMTPHADPRRVIKLFVVPPALGVYDDVLNIIDLLENNKWTEHCTNTVLGSLLESEITRLVGMTQPAPSESASQPLTDALRDVIAERQRQISVKGWTPEHDDTYIGCELAAAAISYIEPVEAENYWPADWHDGSFRPSDYRRNLVKATALLVAELERLDRISATSALSGVSDGDAGGRQ